MVQGQEDSPLSPFGPLPDMVIQSYTDPHHLLMMT